MVGVCLLRQIIRRSSLCVASRGTETFAECFNSKTRAITLKNKPESPPWLLLWILTTAPVTISRDLKTKKKKKKKRQLADVSTGSATKRLLKIKMQ